MINGKEVIVCTPAGRREYLDILYRYLNREFAANVVDRWRLWLNTNDPEDLQYCRSLAANHTWIETEDSTLPVDPNWYGKSIYQFFKNCCEDKIYIRMDDDIAWMHEDAISNLVQFRINNPQYFIVFGNIINNAICSHIHQRMGLLPSIEGKLYGYACMDDVGWKSPTVAEHTHRCFLRNLSGGQLDRYFFDRWELYLCERFSINTFAFLGSEFAKFGGVIGWDEEHELSVQIPKNRGIANCICGNALFSHYAFYTQRNFLNTTDVLKKYQELSYTI